MNVRSASFNTAIMGRGVSRRGKAKGGAVSNGAYLSGELRGSHDHSQAWDYRAKRRDVLAAQVFGPAGWDGQRLWAECERREARADAIFGRKFKMDLPAQISDAARQEIAFGFAAELRDLHGVGVEVSVHRPPKGGNGLNWHCHLGFTARPIDDAGVWRKTKVREWDAPETRRAAVLNWRANWERRCNEALTAAGVADRVTLQSFKARGIDQEPTRHRGMKATDQQRRANVKTNRARTIRINRATANAVRRAAGTDRCVAGSERAVAAAARSGRVARAAGDRADRAVDRASGRRRGGPGAHRDSLLQALGGECGDELVAEGLDNQWDAGGVLEQRGDGPLPGVEAGGRGHDQHAEPGEEVAGQGAVVRIVTRWGGTYYARAEEAQAALDAGATDVPLCQADGRALPPEVWRRTLRVGIYLDPDTALAWEIAPATVPEPEPGQDETQTQATAAPEPQAQVQTGAGPGPRPGKRGR